ncbi:2OG-Fe(II) oxygenase [bacterium]|nr:2OG-Fe(II) oxygenase [Synechococcaceae bacterium WB6_1A_059]NDG33357.1 2OG-Fe(II) oxygenase [bacterium]
MNIELIEHEVNSLDNFICGWYLNDTTICDQIVSFFNNSSKKYLGRTDKYYDPKTKDSIDCELEGDLLDLYQENVLQQCLRLYKSKYPRIDVSSPWAITEGTQIQYYKKNKGYHLWHCERNDASYPAGSRMLVFMTYLNNVGLGGETEFLYQKIKIKPVKGLTLIWPPDWTHTHRGVTAPYEEKYIVTGWFNYIIKLQA